MKKVLIATTALVFTAGVASADVLLSGSGRFGLKYDSKPGPTASKTRLETRLRFNIDASKETDSGAKFGGRIRLQADEGKTNATLSQAYLYVESNGLRVEVGNANTAYDSAALMYNSEIGFTSFSDGDPFGSYYSFDSSGNNGGANYEAIYAAYSFSGFNVKLSYATPDQTAKNGVSEEIGISGDYKFGAFTVSAAYAHNGGGVSKNNLYFIGGEYAIDADTNVGLQYFGQSGQSPNEHKYTLYGNKKFGQTTVGAYYANDKQAGTTDSAFGIGAAYDLGGATLAGGIARGFNSQTYAELGVNFSF